MTSAKNQIRDLIRRNLVNLIDFTAKHIIKIITYISFLLLLKSFDSIDEFSSMNQTKDVVTTQMNACYDDLVAFFTQNHSINEVDHQKKQIFFLFKLIISF